MISKSKFISFKEKIVNVDTNFTIISSLYKTRMNVLEEMICFVKAHANARNKINLYLYVYFSLKRYKRIVYIMLLI